MSLKAFHIIFVSLSVLLSLGFGLWAVLQYMHVHSIGFLAVAIESMAFAVVLVCYGFWFLRKLKNVSFL